jgi:diguanylate cyclase (GGDEF)-like protein
MNIFLLTIALTNLLLGLALRLLVAPPPAPVILKEPRNHHVDDKPAAEKAEAAAEPATPETPVVPVEQLQVEVPPSIELPAAWQDILSPLGPTNHFVEAAVKVLQLEVGRYRNQLVQLENSTRSAGAEPDETQLEHWSNKIRSLNADWLARQSEISRFLQDHSLEMGPLTADGEALCGVLDGQSAQIESTSNNLKTQSPSGETVLKELTRLVHMAHGLRDQMHESLTSIMRTANKLGNVTDELRFDSPELLSRVGFEALLHQWRQDHPKRTRQVSLALLDLDKLGSINHTEGTQQGDLILASTASIIVSSMRNDRGFDRIARVGANSYALFLADVGPRGAFSAAERMRQTIEAVTFAYADKEIRVRISAGVAELAATDDSIAILAKLRKGIHEAKRLGGNCTAVDEGAGPKVLNNATLNIPPKIVQIERAG